MDKQQDFVLRTIEERGVKFVTLNYGGWDMHDNIAEGMKGRVPPLDHYISKYAVYQFQ
jgi:hypothetical protein